MVLLVLNVTQLTQSMPRPSIGPALLNIEKNMLSLSLPTVGLPYLFTMSSSNLWSLRMPMVLFVVHWLKFTLP